MQPELKCNVSYKDDKTKEERICQDGAPRAAVYERAGLLVCKDCYPDVVAYLAKPWGKKFGPFAARQSLHRIQGT